MNQIISFYTKWESVDILKWHTLREPNPQPPGPQLSYNHDKQRHTKYCWLIVVIISAMMRRYLVLHSLVPIQTLMMLQVNPRSLPFMGTPLLSCCIHSVKITIARYKKSVNCHLLPLLPILLPIKHSYCGIFRYRVVKYKSTKKKAHQKEDLYLSGNPAN